MKKLVGLAVLAFLLYQGYKAGLPWIEKRLEATSGRGVGSRADGDSDPDAAESNRCVDLAQRANRTLGDTMRQFSEPPFDQQEWTSAFISVSGDVGAAESACFCSTDACAAASAAIDEMRDLSLSFDGIARGRTRGIGNPARAQERIEELLAEAAHYVGR